MPSLSFVAKIFSQNVFTRNFLGVDRIGEECWNVGCDGDTGEICEWCGLHDGHSQICCNLRDDYTNNHANCDGAEYTTDISGHQCVILPTQNQIGNIPVHGGEKKMRLTRSIKE